MKNALLLTGAAARISQEVAMIDLLKLNKGLILDPKETYLAGFSSGSLNILAINACFRSDNPLSWDTFYKGEVLKNLSNDDVFVKTHPIHWDTLPLRKTIKSFLSLMGVKALSDLTFQSNVLVFCVDKLKTFWVDSNRSKYATVSLCDLLMSSTAIPVIFPSQRINGVDDNATGLPDSAYTDGGSNGTFKRFKGNLRKVTRKNGAFENLFIVSPMRETKDDMRLPVAFDADSFELSEFQDFLENISMNNFLKFLKKLNKANKRNKIAKKIYVSIPELKENFDILDFSNQMEKYYKVIDWGTEYSENITIEIATYLKMKSK